MSDKVHTFTDENWQQEVLASPLPVLVDFWADWCIPCKNLVPIIEAIAEKYAGRLKVGKLDCSSNLDVPGQLGVQTLPTLLIFKGGVVAEQRVGQISRDNLIKLVDSHL